MTEKENKNWTAEQKAEDTEIVATIPQDNEITVPVKFNKQVKNLTLGEASLLAQKGMKFDLIRDDFETLKKLAAKSNKSVPEYLQALKQREEERKKAELLEKCSGDNDLVEKIIALEENKDLPVDTVSEIKRFFPKIQNEDALPQEVVESAKLKGTLLLDEYLRYLLAQKKRQEKSIKAQEKAADLSIGSQQSQRSALSPESQEFIKGLWN